jgi:thiol-disulfide isomerase/thioredoxin
LRQEASLKQRLASLGLGLLVLGVVRSFVIFVSADLRLAYAIGAFLLLCSATWMGGKGRGDWLTAALLSAPLIAAFSFLVLPALPVLWLHLLLWVMATVIGLHLLGATRPHRILSIYGTGLLFSVSLWYCTRYVPEQVARSLTHVRDAAAPTFMFQPVSDGAVPTGPMAGKVLVIDFFSTTCAPCITELPELARVRDEVRDKADIEFVVVANGSGGDTPERFKSFADRRHVTLPLAFDSGGKAHASFGFTGVPALVVLDRTGRVRLTREGYNTSEVNFRHDLAQFLKAL